MCRCCAGSRAQGPKLVPGYGKSRLSGGEKRDFGGAALRSAAAAVVAAVVAAAAVIAEHGEQKNQNDNPPEAVAIVTAHSQHSFIMTCIRCAASGSRCISCGSGVPLPSLMICGSGNCVTAAGKPEYTCI